MRETILVLNSGAANIRFSLYDIVSQTLIYNGMIEKYHYSNELTIADEAGITCDTIHFQHDQTINPQITALQSIIDWLTHKEDVSIIAAGHRLIHGGDKYTKPTLIDDDMITALEELTLIAPLHQPCNVTGIKLLKQAFPNIPQVACFDTSFHHNQPDVAKLYALPKALREQGIHRFGFHGLSFEYITQYLPHYLDQHANDRVIIAHLGDGASLCALYEGQSIATTMGFSSLDGLPMGSRCGSIDAGVIFYLNKKLHYTMDEIYTMLYQQSGLFGLSEISNDMREIEQSNTMEAKLAIDLFIYRFNCELGSLVAALGGVDTLIFTGGIGENDASIRKALCKKAKWLNIKIDDHANAASEALISQATSSVNVLVIHTNEELMIAEHTANKISAYKFSHIINY